MEAWMISLNSSRILINTIFSFFITNSSRYLNTTSRTSNCTSCVYSIITTMYRTLLQKSRCFSLYCWRTILINTICRICLVSFSNITNSSIYINTTIRTFNCTIHINTISFTFNSTDNWYSRITTLNSSKRLINTILSIFSITNSSSYLNSTTFTYNSALNWNSIIITIYSTLLIETIECPLYSSRLLPNTI